jgi:hypothetical protein
MRRRLLAAMAVLGPTLAQLSLAQQPAPPPIIATPLPPLQSTPIPPSSAPFQVTPAQPAPPPLQATPNQPSFPQSGTPTPEMPAAPNVWLARPAAILQVLDKVNAQSQTLTVKVGQSATYSSLTIQVRACDVRPPDQPADAAAFLVITDSHKDEPGFSGWMLHNEPSISMLQHPLYDVRVKGCGG